MPIKVRYIIVMFEMGSFRVIEHSSTSTPSSHVPEHRHTWQIIIANTLAHLPNVPVRHSTSSHIAVRHADIVAQSADIAVH